MSPQTMGPIIGVALILIVALLAVRAGLRQVMEANAAAWHLDAVVVTDAFMIFALGMIVTQRIEMYLRDRRVLAGGTDIHVDIAT